MVRTGLLAFAITALCLIAFSEIGHASSARKHPISRDGRPTLSVMSYNVKGLPWPIASGRSEALVKITARLAEMRDEGRQPQIVLLQEAFTPEAKAIADGGGYRFVAQGPTATETFTPTQTASQQLFDARASWIKGETEGKWEDSGLLILSDYPIIATRRLAFPSFACAGFDCLANKGIVLAWIKVPQGAEPIAIVDTHLNSRNASGVPDDRSRQAFAWQVAQAKAFVNRYVPSSAPAIFSGDFNIGADPARQSAAKANGSLLSGGRDALRQALFTHSILDPNAIADASLIVRRSKDWQFFRSGSNSSLSLEQLSVPFGREIKGKPLSDHFGYVATYGIAHS